MTTRLRWSGFLAGAGLFLLAIFPAQADLIVLPSIRDDPETRGLQLGSANGNFLRPSLDLDAKASVKQSTLWGGTSAFQKAAVDYFDRKDFENAATMARRVIQLNPKHAGAYYLLGSSLVALKKSEEGKQTLLKALQLKSHFPQALGNLAIAHYQLGETAHALERLIAAFDQKVDYADGWGNYLTILSRELVPRKDLDRLPQPPTDEIAAQWHWRAALNAMRAGNAQLSSRHFLRSLFLDLNNPNVHNDFAIFLRQVDRTPLALPFLQAAHALAPDSSLVRNNLDRFRREVRIDALQSQLEEELTTEESAICRLELAKLYEGTEQNAKALDCLRKAVALAPRDLKYRIELAQSLSRNRLYAEALEAIRTVGKAEPNDPRWMFREAWLIMKLQPEPGSPELHRAVKKSSAACKATDYQRIDCLRLLAQTLILDGDNNRAQQVQKRIDILAEKPAQK